ncbi:hypothetical protein Acr_15g0005280 [Actinidia rufa]|uniref:Uncharacterized protein n=1 Tax=Actinidia rufa TaxID=165716 RepID=A0A7J0FT89_9ERIC|nr:hypothetical protein Acr_15g0005280 [Actinidia rufa]
MALEELNSLRESYSFPLGVRTRLPEEGDTITSACPGEAQLVLNAWRSVACSMALWQVFKYTLFLFEFRNLFSLNSNPKPDQGWLCFKARYKKTLLGGYPSNVKGWKSKFFFVSGDEWEFPEGSSWEGALKVPRTWGIPNKHCNNLPRLYGEEPKVFEEIFKSMASGTAGEGRSRGGAPSSLGNAGETRPSHEHVQQESLPETIRYVQENQLQEARREALKIEEWKFFGDPCTCQRVVIGEKRTREGLASSLSKKGKVDDGSKWKGVDREPEGKKVTTLGNVSTTSATAWSRLGEGTSANLGTVLGPTASILGSPSIAEKLLRGVIPPTDKEKVLVLGSSLTGRAGRRGSMPLSKKGKQLLWRANDELAKMKSDRDSLADKFEKSGVLVVELREALDKAKESTVEEFKSLSEFLVAVEDSASKYFGKGFEFCKV